tara:strand:+ start:127 stop:1284 length:1158 start_codon:yes stop_codon:yes gene_type:complete
MKKKTLKKLIRDYQLIFTNLGFKINPNFKKDFLHIKRMATNGTKISFIKADKIKGLQDNIKGFKLKPNDKEQRDKYFQAVKPSKFLDSMILQDDTKQNLFCSLREQFNRDFIGNLKSKLKLYKGEDIGKEYSANGNIVGCMGGCPESWFKVYNHTENLQLATLKDQSGTLLIRALLWYDKTKNNYWLENSYENNVINGEESLRRDYQKQLLAQVLEHLTSKEKNKDKITFGFGCSFTCYIDKEARKEMETQYNVTINKKVQDSDVGLMPLIKNFNSSDYDCFPYSDTFESICKNTGRWHTQSNSGDSDFIWCRSTEGQDENDKGQNCDCCDTRTEEDYIHYSEVEEEMICDDCSTYIEERDDTCRSDNAIYNNYTGNYIYRHDIE